MIEKPDCVAVYTGYPGETYVSMNIETGRIGRCGIYIGKDEPNPGAAYHRALSALEGRIKGAAPGAGNTGDGRVEQIDKAVSTSIVNENKEDCKR
ncbi:MAG: hypothetical protein KHX24_02270 [Clostridiales bacterium]|nr:hypothetical protein [Clostridiales bacterium]